MSYMFTGSDWTNDTLNRIIDEVYKINNEELKFDVYSNQFEIISSEQMLDAYTSVGMPINYNHWSFGKHFMQEEHGYASGRNGLAYELVVNTSPCVNYLMEDNTATLQALVIAHAGIGHNSFFKTNYLFKEWTDASTIVEYLDFAKNYIRKCEERYGIREVEDILDSCHALKYHGLDRYKRPKKPNAAEEMARVKLNEEFVQSNYNPVIESFVNSKQASSAAPNEPIENILKFIEKNSPVLQTWQRELVRIVRMISQYFYPQIQTKVMNEGFACWTHGYIMNRLYDKGLINDGAMLEYASVQSGVLYQQKYGSFNPYTLGLAIFKDIERICKNPDDEDKELFPEIAGQNYIEVIKDVVKNYRDESFIRQFLSPKVMQQFKMFRLADADRDHYLVRHIHNDNGFREIRKTLADSYEISNMIPDIQITNANLGSTRKLELRHSAIKGRHLVDDEARETLRHISRLWGFPISLESYDGDSILAVIRA